MTSRQDDRGEIHYQMMVDASDSTIDKHKQVYRFSPAEM